MNTLLKLNPLYNYQIKPTEKYAVLLFDNGHRYKALVDLIVIDALNILKEGPRELNKLLGVLSKSHGAVKTRETISQLIQDQFIVYDTPELSESMIRIWCDENHRPDQLHLALKNTRIAIESIGVDTFGIKQVLEKKSVNLTSLEETDFFVVLTEDVASGKIKKYNELALRKGKSWLLALPFGRTFWFAGFVPEKTPCWECFAAAIRRNRIRVPNSEDALERLPGNRDGRNRPAHSWALHYLESYIMQYIFWGQNTNLEGKLVCIDARTGIVESSREIRFSGVCTREHSQHLRRSTSWKSLIPREKKFIEDGGHRTADPQAAYERYQHLIDPYLGFFKNMVRSDGGYNENIYTYRMQYCRTVFGKGPKELMRMDFGYSFGKGMSSWQSKASCLFESIERYSGQWRESIQTIKGSYKEVAYKAVHPGQLLQFSKQQYSSRKSWNETSPPAFTVYDLFDESREINWVEAYSITKKRPVYIPSNYGFYQNSKEGESFAYADSNGCSAGLTIEEAILQGLYEVIERDALALALGHCAPLIPVNSSTVKNTYFAKIDALLSARNRSLNVFRVPSESGIPVYLALSVCQHNKRPVLTGYGCHLDPILASSRAVTELVQGLPREEWDNEKASSRDPYDAQKKIQAERILGGALREKELLVDVPNLATNDILEDIRLIQRKLESQGLEVIVLDQTDPEIGCPVVKVIIPGMYHYLNRKGGDRMMNVPVRMSWRSPGFTENDIEPVWFAAH